MKVPLNLVFVFAVISTAYGGIYDFVDVEDYFYDTWNVPRVTSNNGFLHGVCQATKRSGEVVDGVCKTLPECYLDKGEADNADNFGCGLLRTCCTHYGTCGRQTSAKISYFQSSTTSINTQCSYTIKPLSHVCQIRLDFVQFELAKPVSTAEQNWICNDQYLSLPTGTGVVKLCGTNTGQHFYVHVDSNSPVTFNIVNNLASALSFKIKITQLFCSSSKLHTLKYKDSSVSDLPLLAPAGCQQYYTNPSGSVTSLGYDGTAVVADGTAVITSANTYAICFQKTSQSSYIEYVFSKLYINTDGDESTATNYIYIPGLINKPPPFVAKIVNNEIVTTTPSTPLKSIVPGVYYLSFANPKGNSYFTVNYSVA